MKELPKVFVSPIDKKIKNNKDLFYSKLLGDRKDTKDILKEIGAIFHSKDFVYKSKVEITTDEGVQEEYIVGKSGASLLTLDGKAILIATIKDIRKI